MAVVTVDITDSISVITMNRPEALNAFNADMMHELCEAFFAATSSERVKVAVLTGAGRAFSAGADLKSMGAATAPGRHGLEALLFSIIDFPKPLIIAANGLGVGIGATICGLSDVTIMAESARFKAPFSALGLTAEAASTYTFSRLMGYQRASWFLLSSEWFSASSCVEMGLAMKTCSDEAVLDSAFEHARILARLPLISLQQTKELLIGPHREAMKAAVRAENLALAELRGNPANAEAIKAFVEKREADFSSL